MRAFDTGATRDDEGTKPDYRGYLSPRVLQRFGQYMTEHRVQADGTLRASDNWKKGIPQQEYLSSLLRHVVDLWAALEGGNECAPLSEKEVQDLLCAIRFNADGLLHERLKAQALEPGQWAGLRWIRGEDTSIPINKKWEEVVPPPARLSFKTWKKWWGSKCQAFQCSHCSKEYQRYLDHGLLGVPE